MFSSLFLAAVFKTLIPETAAQVAVEAGAVAGNATANNATQVKLATFWPQAPTLWFILKIKDQPE
jgi:hypothetical protein